MGLAATRADPGHVSSPATCFLAGEQPSRRDSLAPRAPLTSHPTATLITGVPRFAAAVAVVPYRSCVRSRLTNLLLLKTSLMSTAYRELYAVSDGELKGLHVEILRELDLRELARDESVRVRAMAFAELCDILRVSPGHMSALLTELESLALVEAVRARGRHRQAFRITPTGTAAVHNYYERVIVAASSAEADHRQRALRWLLDGTDGPAS